MAANDNIGISNPQEPHLACVFLLDISGSMSGTPIENLNEGIRKFKDVYKRQRGRRFALYS